MRAVHNHRCALHAVQWYAWPEGYLGQSFNLSGKMEPRATALRDDTDLLSQFCKVRREESQFSEHTITTAEDSAMMVSAVVGADVDMGLLKAGGSASFEMYQVSWASCNCADSLAASHFFSQFDMHGICLSATCTSLHARLGPCHAAWNSMRKPHYVTAISCVEI